MTSTPTPRSSKVTPQSTIKSSPACSSTRQFIPISPSPPSATIFTVASTFGGPASGDVAAVMDGAEHSRRCSQRFVYALRHRCPMASPALEGSTQSRRFLIVTGKGGVGKTTVCAAEALALASKGKRVLIAMCHAKERLSTMLGGPPIGSDLTEVTRNVWAVNMDPAKAIEEYGMMKLKVRVLYKAVFDNKYTRVFFRAVPKTSKSGPCSARRGGTRARRTPTARPSTTSSSSTPPPPATAGLGHAARPEDHR